MRARAAIATTLATRPSDGRAAGAGAAGSSGGRGGGVVGGGTVISLLRSDPPLTLRQTGEAAVHLVSTAAGPLGGDDLALDLVVAAGTTLEVGSVASTLVLPGRGESSMLITAVVGEGATLRFTPEPTVLAAGCFHRMSVRLKLAPGARVLWREEIVFGRYGERPGRCHTRFDATVGGRPLLRQEFTVGEEALNSSPAVFGGASCVGTTLITGPAAPPEALVADGVAVLPLAGPGTLVSALAADAVELRARLRWGESTVLNGPQAPEEGRPR